MANSIIGNCGDKLRMSNGTTSVLLTTICLSGSRLAVTEHEKDLIIFLAERDQGIVGGGMVGFDIGEMPWEEESLEQDKAFMIKVIDHAIDGLGYETLTYKPNIDIIIPRLQHFRRLIEAMDKESIQMKRILQWYEDTEESEPINNGYPCCGKHNILLSCFGCIACNDK